MLDDTERGIAPTLIADMVNGPSSRVFMHRTHRRRPERTLAPTPGEREFRHTDPISQRADSWEHLFEPLSVGRG